MLRYSALLISLFFITNSKAQSYRDGELGNGCKSADDTTYDQVTINNVIHKYYLYSKSYDHTDTSMKYHYKGIVVLYNFSNSTIGEKKMFAKFIVDKFGLEEITIVSSCQILNSMWSSIRLNEEFEKRKKKSIGGNCISFSKESLQ